MWKKVLIDLFPGMKPVYLNLSRQVSTHFVFGKGVRKYPGFVSAFLDKNGRSFLWYMELIGRLLRK